MTLSCEKCGSTFTRREKLNYHIENKSCKEKKYSCRYCDDRFTTSNSMYRHMKHNCKVKKREDIMRDEIYERLLLLENSNKRLEKSNEKIMAENEKLKNKVTRMERKIKSKTITNNGTLNINNGVINNITLVAYGSEDMSKIGRKEILQILKKGYNSTVHLTEAIHFNPKYPEYNNVYITNMKDKYAMMYDGDKWTLTMKESLIDKIYEHKRNYIEANIDDYLNSLRQSDIRSLNRWLDTEDDDFKIKLIKEKIKLLLYNHRDIPINSEEKKKRSIENSNIRVLVRDISKSDVTDQPTDNKYSDHAEGDLDENIRKKIRKHTKKVKVSKSKNGKIIVKSKAKSGLVKRPVRRAKRKN